jgi:hypothetical protein
MKGAKQNNLPPYSTEIQSKHVTWTSLGQACPPCSPEIQSKHVTWTSLGQTCPS